jgi:excisionase family DNA binding protein
MAHNLSPTEAATQVGVHVDTIKRWAATGKIPAIRTPGGWWKFDSDELTAWLDSLRNSEPAA